jgi:carboxyl-terminal processing protease
LALALGPLTGCGANETGVGRIVTGYGYALNAESEAQLKRLRKIYDDNVIPESGSAQYEHFRDAFVRIKAEYVRDIKASELVDKALKGVEGLDLKPHGVQAAVLIEASLDQMIGDLDPHSNYLNADEFREMRVSMKGEFGGLGIRVSGENGVIKVVAPIKGTPAYRAGLKPGDLVTHVDGTALKGLSLSKAVQMMRGRPGTDIRLTIERRDVTPFVVTITRAVIKIDAVTWRAEGNIGYIRVNSFVGKLEEDMNDAVKGLRKEIGPKLAGLVLDLRNNPGGLLDQSVFLADMFIEKGRIVAVRGRDNNDNRSYDAESGEIFPGIPMVVLINDGSASASEIVAGALQEHRRATVMGERSFGKGSIQTIMPLPIEGAIKFTTAMYYLPSGRTIQGQGIEPEIAVTGTAGAEHRTEASLPGALPSVAAVESRIRASIEEKNCPKVSTEKDDLMLGCALSLLRAGSEEKFLASVDRTM